MSTVMTQGALERSQVWVIEGSKVNPRLEGWRKTSWKEGHMSRSRHCPSLLWWLYIVRREGEWQFLVE